MAKSPNRYEQIIEQIFLKFYREGSTEFEFERIEIEQTAQMIGISLPKNIGDVLYSFALTDEQALLAKVRYNRLIDIFTGLTCYSLQNHLRTTVKSLGQVETDELYIGVDRRGAQYVIPVQAKGGKDKLGIVQLEQDYAVCAEKFSPLICLPIAAQFMGANLIALFMFEKSVEGVIGITSEKHYRLVEPHELSSEELLAYRSRRD